MKQEELRFRSRYRESYPDGANECEQCCQRRQLPPLRRLVAPLRVKAVAGAPPCLDVAGPVIQAWSKALLYEQQGEREAAAMQRYILQDRARWAARKRAAVRGWGIQVA